MFIEIYFYALICDCLYIQNNKIILYCRDDLIAHLQKLQDSTKTHPWETASRTLEEAFGKDWKNKLRLDPDPIGSGCIAQVSTDNNIIIII